MKRKDDHKITFEFTAREVFDALCAAHPEAEWPDPTLTDCYIEPLGTRLGAVRLTYTPAPPADGMAHPVPSVRKRDGVVEAER